MFDLYDNLTARLRAGGNYVWPLVLRLIMFWEFWEAGIEKLNGKNWFADIPWADWQNGFPWPFSAISEEWPIATASAPSASAFATSPPLRIPPA